MTCDSHVTTYLTCKLEELDFGNSKPTTDDVAMATVLVPRERISSSNNKSKEAYYRCELPKCLALFSVVAITAYLFVLPLLHRRKPTNIIIILT